MNAQSRGRTILIHGVAMTLAGLLWGLAVPHTPYPRLALGAHIQFVTNGMLLTVLAVVLLAVPLVLGRRAFAVMRLAAWLTWPMAISEAANAWWGANKMLPIAAAQAGASGAAPWQEGVILVTHIAAGLVLIAAWALLLAAVVRSPKPAA